MNKFIALIDCNNFFVSCECLFDPSLKGKPVGILSSNDGCFIARSNELKALGVPMGAPMHQYTNTIIDHNVVIKSSNFHLYKDLSLRVMRVIKQFYHETEVYSVDEAFAYCNSNDPAIAMDHAIELRQRLLQWVGIPVSIGIAPTKTLAKVACEYVKQNHGAHGCHILENKEEINKTLSQLPVEDLWGIGRKIAQILRCHNIKTGLQLKNANPPWILKKLSINTYRLQQELYGRRCCYIQPYSQGKQSILRSRSFGTDVSDFDSLAEAVAKHTTNAANELRRQQGTAAHIGVFIKSNHHSFKPQYSNSSINYLIEPTNYTPHLITAAKKALKDIYKTGYEYHKCGVFLGDLFPENASPRDLFATDSSPCYSKKAALNQALDKITEIWGPKALFSAALGSSHTSNPRCQKPSKSFTTKWSDLQIVRAR